MIAQFNLCTFRRPEVVRELATWDWIETGEARLLDGVQNEIRSGDILEIGVGAGRLVSRLCCAGKSYTGIDYSPEMVNACRDRFPRVPFHCADARDLGRFQSGRFSLVVFSFNGLDYASHGDRLRILDEVWRVLAAGGLFLFSSHNRESELYGARDIFATDSLSDYAIVRENTNGISYLCYYARQREVRQQLITAGFKREVRCCDREGMEKGALRSGWLHYLARK